MTTVLILFASSLSVWLGLVALAVVLQWRSLYPILRWLGYIPLGLLAVLFSHGLVGVAEALGCLLITAC